MKRRMLSILVCLTMLVSLSSFGVGTVFAADPIMSNMQSLDLENVESNGWSTSGGFIYNVNTSWVSLHGNSGASTFYEGRTFSSPMSYTMYLISGDKADGQTTSKSQKAYIYFNYADADNWYRIAVSGSPSTNSYNATTPASSTFAVGTVVLEKKVAGALTTLYNSEVNAPLPSFVNPADGKIIAGTPVEQLVDLQAQITSNPRFKWVTLGHRFNTTVNADGSISCWVSNDRNMDNVKLRDLFVNVADTGDVLTSGKIGCEASGYGLQMSGVTVTDGAGTYNEFEPLNTYSSDKNLNYNNSYVPMTSEWDNTNVSLLLDTTRSDDGLNDRWKFNDGSTLISKDSLTGTQEIVAFVKNMSSSDNGKIKFYFGYQDASNHYYISINGKAAANTVTLTKVENGIETEIGAYAGNYTKFANSDTSWVMLRIMLTEDGYIGAEAGFLGTVTKLLTVKDSTFVSGKVGFATTGCSAQLRNITMRAKNLGVYSDDFNRGTAAAGSASVTKMGTDWSVSGGTNNFVFSNRPQRLNNGDGGTWSIRNKYVPTGSYTFGFDYNNGDGGSSGWGGTQYSGVYFSQVSNGATSSENYALTIAAHYNTAPFVKLEKKISWTNTVVMGEIKKSNFTATDWQYNIWNKNASCRYDISVELNGRVIVYYTTGGIKRILIDSQAALYTSSNGNGDGATIGPRPGPISLSCPGFASVFFDNFTLTELPTTLTDSTVKCEGQNVTSLQTLGGKDVTVSSRIIRNTPSSENTNGLYVAVLRDADGNIVQIQSQPFAIGWDVPLTSNVSAILSIPTDADTVAYTITGYYIDGETIVPYIPKVVFPAL